MGTVIHLRRRLPDVSSGRPESEATPLPPGLRPTALLFGLAPGRACPFHTGPVGCPTCRLVSVALVLASRRTGVTRYPASRSSDFPRIDFGLPRRDTRPSDHLAGPPSLPGGSIAERSQLGGIPTLDSFERCHGSTPSSSISSEKLRKVLTSTMMPNASALSIVGETVIVWTMSAMIRISSPSRID